MKRCIDCGKPHNEEKKRCEKCKLRKQDYDKSYYQNPMAKEKRKKAVKAWKKANPDRVREQNRLYKRKKRAQKLPETNEIKTQIEGQPS